MKRIFVLAFTALFICASASAQFKLFDALKKGAETVKKTGEAVKEVIDAVAPEKQDTIYVPFEKDTVVNVWREETKTVTTPGTVTHKYIPPTTKTETVRISTTLPVWRLQNTEKYVTVDCSQYQTRTTVTPVTLVEQFTVIDEQFLYAHSIDIEVIRAQYPYTSYFYLNDPKGEIINRSTGKLDGEQRQYSVWFSSTSSKKFPFYDAIRPMSQMLGVGSGTATIAGQKELLTPENAPAEIKTLVADFFDDTQNGYAVAVEGKMDTEERNLKARSLLQQYYLRFFDDGLKAEFVGEEMNWEPVTFDENYTLNIGSRKVPLAQASDESRTLYDYIKANPEQETDYPFAGDNTGKKYTFEYRFYDEKLLIFGALFTPLTLRFDVRTFYDEHSDATYFVYFYSLGYDLEALAKEGIGLAGSATRTGGFDYLRKSIREACGIDLNDYPLSPMDIIFEQTFRTFEAVKIDIETFFAYSLRIQQYITMRQLLFVENETYKVDCSRLEKQTDQQLVSDYITVIEDVDISYTDGGGEWVKEVSPGKKKRISRYVKVPTLCKKRVWLPAWVTAGRGEKEDLAPKPKTQPAAPKKPDVEFAAPVLTASKETYVALQAFAPEDIAEDAQYVYLIASAGYDTRSLVAIEKQSGTIKRVKYAPADKSLNSPRKVMNDGNGRVLVEIANEGVFLCDGFSEPAPTRLQMYTEQWNELVNTELAGAMPDGNLLVDRHARNIIIQDRNSGTVLAQTDKLNYSSSTDYKKQLIILPNGDILHCTKEYAQGKINRLSGLSGGNAALEVSDVKTLLGDKYYAITKIITTASGAVVAISNHGIHRSTDAGKTWKTVNRDSYDHTLVDLAADAQGNVYVIYQKSYGNYELRKYSPDLSKGLLSMKIESKIPLIRNGEAVNGKFAGVGDAPKMIYIDSANNLWILGGGNEYTQGLLIVNPSGITGFPALTGKQSVTMTDYFK